MTSTPGGAPAPLGTRSDAAGQPFGGDGVLVVDDTPSALQLVVELLRRDGYAVRPASSGTLALRSALRQPPELVLLDVQLPDIDGYEVCRRLKADPRTAHVPVLFLSALRDTASRVKGLEVGGLDFISKPFQAEEVLARVRTHLLLGRAMRALEQVRADLEQTVVERSTDLGQVSHRLEQLVVEHRETTRRLNLASRALESALDAIIVTDGDGIIQAANASAEELTGLPRDELIGHPAGPLFEDPEGNGGRMAMVPGRAPGPWAGELVVRRADGTVLPVWLSVSEFAEGSHGVTHLVGVFSDMSERKQAEARIEFLAQHDLLTGLPNRGALRDRFYVARSLAHRQQDKLALLILDLDKFKTVNDALGHPVGDEYLRVVAAAVGDELGGAESLCRPGGDEFMLLLDGVRSPQDVSAVADRILQRIDADFLVAGHALHLTGSIGVALYPDDGQDFDDLAAKADIAMYEAKQGGRNTVRFHTEAASAGLQHRIALEADLRAALANDSLSVHYQPQVELATGRIVGLEALVRWHRPGVGPVPPGDYIPLAEASGLIIGLGESVVRMVCRQTRRWIDAGIAVPVSVNVSPVQIWHGKLEEMLLAALDEAGVPASLLEIEITESGLVDDTTKTREMIARIQSHGIRLSIDDFLTGYSNFAYLRQFHPSHLKIDRSFVGGTLPGSENRAIVQAAIQMARILRVATVAEGIETTDQRDWLQADGCLLGQGFLFARPLPAGEVEPLLRAGRCGPAASRPPTSARTPLARPGAASASRGGTAARRPAAPHPADAPASQHRGGPR